MNYILGPLKIANACSLHMALYAPTIHPDHEKEPAKSLQQNQQCYESLNSMFKFTMLEEDYITKKKKGDQGSKPMQTNLTHDTISVQSGR